MSDYEMRKKLIEAFMKSDAYSMMTPKAREQQIRIFADDRGLTDQTKRNVNSDYYELNKESIIEKQKTIIKCSICSKEIKKGTEARHKRSNDCRLTGEIIKKKDNIIRRLQEDNERLRQIIKQS